MGFSQRTSLARSLVEKLTISCVAISKSDSLLWFSILSDLQAAFNMILIQCQILKC